MSCCTKELICNSFNGLMLTTDSDQRKNCAEMENLMAPPAESRRKKTRRGKKRLSKHGNKSEFDCSFAEDSVLIQQEIKSMGKKKNYLRPYSPKAPRNSTQFLIEDSGNDRINLNVEMDSFVNMASPDHALSNRSEMEDYEDVSFYEDQEKKYLGNDDEYSLMCFDETTAFVGREFERDFQTLQENTDDFHLKLNDRRNEFRNVSKDVIVKKYIRLENRLRRKEAKTLKIKNPMYCDLKRLLKKNESLRRENGVLKSLLS